RRELARVATGAVACPFVAVTLVALSVTPWLPITMHQPFGDGLAVALVLGTLAAASSPAITKGMLGELDARGPVARALLAVTVAQHVAVVLSVARVLAPAHPPATGGGLTVAAGGAAPVRRGVAVAGGAAARAAGARLGVRAAVWRWGRLCVGVRAVSLRYGGLWAGRRRGVTPVLAREGWPGLISQAGTALALAGLARRAFPEWGVSLEALIVA